MKIQIFMKIFELYMYLKLLTMKNLIILYTLQPHLCSIHLPGEKPFPNPEQFQNVSVLEKEKGSMVLWQTPAYELGISNEQKYNRYVYMRHLWYSQWKEIPKWMSEIQKHCNFSKKILKGSTLKEKSAKNVFKCCWDLNRIWTAQESFKCLYKK